MKAIYSLVVVCALFAVGFASPAELPKGGGGKGAKPKEPPAPVKTLAQKVTDQWNEMKTHVLHGDAKGNADAGRHTVSAWQEKNHDEGWCHKETHICAFRVSVSSSSY
ncbi:hypothetical protein HGRIS_006009 [Hohenbuehelia grisea]|uniref:Uncharacterized protein n=1 Tax=Hohenbuehelia grisea TaxID=104357 RepID=A0ABR3JYV1_9AGAR